MIRVKSLTGLLVALSLAITATASAAEERTVSGMAPWQAEGRVFQVGPDEVLFLGKFDGILYVEGAEGALDASLLLCPATVNMHVSQNKTEGSGHCIVTGFDGSMAYGRWECEGVRGLCQGRLTLTGGTGPYEGITGSGKMIIRTVLSALAADFSNGEVVSGAAGLALWPELKYSIPEK